MFAISSLASEPCSWSASSLPAARRDGTDGRVRVLDCLRHDRCSELTALGSTTSYEACHAAVTEDFVTNAGSG